MTTLFGGVGDGLYLTRDPHAVGDYDWHIYELPAEAATEKGACEEATVCYRFTTSTRYEARRHLTEALDSTIPLPPKEWAERVQDEHLPDLASVIAYPRLCPECAVVLAAERGILRGMHAREDGVLLYLHDNTVVHRDDYPFMSARETAARHGVDFPPDGHAPRGLSWVREATEGAAAEAPEAVR